MNLAQLRTGTYQVVLTRSLTANQRDWPFQRVDRREMPAGERCTLFIDHGPRGESDYTLVGRDGFAAYADEENCRMLSPLELLAEAAA